MTCGVFLGKKVGVHHLQRREVHYRELRFQIQTGQGYH